MVIINNCSSAQKYGMSKVLLVCATQFDEVHIKYYLQQTGKCCGIYIRSAYHECLIFSSPLLFFRCLKKPNFQLLV